MKKSHFENITNSQEIIDSIICNKCGKEFLPGETGEITYDNDIEFHHYQSIGGYNSHIGDETEFSFDICDDCMIEFMTNMKIVPYFRDRNAYGESLEQQQEWYKKWLQEKRK